MKIFNFFLLFIFLLIGLTTVVESQFGMGGFRGMGFGRRGFGRRGFGRRGFGRRGFGRRGFGRRGMFG
uniref:Uncharacterized protein n=1 Tax=Parastrongyloides trichosuri TaxID=131310 RepID=A0A0N4Z994_PARTI